MSYDIPKQNSNSVSSNASLTKPLLGDDLQRMSDNIQNQLQGISKNVAELYNLSEKIGTSQDTKSVHDDIQNTIKKANHMCQTCKEMLRSFKDTQVGSQQANLSRMQQYANLSKTLNDLSNKFQAVGSDIKKKEQEYINMARKSLIGSRRASSIHDRPSFSDSQDNIRGTTNQQQVYDDAQHLEDAINERQKEIDIIERVMIDVHGVVKEIGMELISQREKLERVDDNMKTAKVNISGGLVQLEQAEKKQRTGQQTLCIVMLVIILVVVLIICVFMAMTPAKQ